MNRKFIEIDPERHDLDELRELASYGEFYTTTLAWDVLWQSQAVVILAEAGAGKTTELQAQTESLAQLGKAAFFIPIEELADADLDRSLRIGDETRFAEWLESDEIGYFLLDSVDETRLVNKSFESAIKTLVRRLSAAFSRCRFVITCRFNDWRWHIDQSTVTSILPPVPPSAPPLTSIEPTDEGLLDPIFADKRNDDVSALDNDPSEPPQPYRLVALAPLGTNQWRTMADARNVQSSDEFLQAIYDCNAKESASRPLDLDRLIKYWQQFGELGTLTERLQYDAEQRLLESNDKYQSRSALALETATAGTETLAAALTLCKFRSIRLPKASTDSRVREQSLDPRTVLSDWTDPTLGELVNRAMFHGTSYGCVGFHHRNMQPYFAAKYLDRLSQTSLSYRRLRALLFGNVADKTILRPSMAGIAAWLSMTEPRVYQWLLNISPETLMSYGDPENLSDQQCGEVLRAFCEKFASRTDTGLRLHREQATRLAGPSLGIVLRRLWQHHANSDNHRHLFLRMIEHGPCTDAVDLAIGAALDTNYPIQTTEYALQAAAAAAPETEKRRLIIELLPKIENLDGRISGTTVRLFYPGTLHNDELNHIVRYAAPIDSGVWLNDLKRVVNELAESVDGATALRFIHAWAPLLDTKPHIQSARIGLSERYLWLVRPIASLCARILKLHDVAVDEITASAIESVARAKHYRVTNYVAEMPDLVETISKIPQLNEFFFWRSIRRQADKTGEPVLDFWSAFRLGNSWALGEADIDWLSQRMCEAESAADRRVAMSALIYLRPLWETDADLRDRIHAAATAGHLGEDLRSAIRRANKPTRLSKMDERHRRKALAKRAQDEQSWRDFHDRHRRQPDLLADDSRAVTNEGFWDRYNFVDWLKRRAPADDSWGVREWWPLREGFDEAVVEAARDAIIRYWPHYTPPLESEKEKPNQHSLELDVGLSGLNFLAAIDADWAVKLSHNEAEIAIRYALEERSRLPYWASRLFEAHTQAADTIVRSQIQWDFDQAEVSTYRFGVLDTLRYADVSSTELFMPLLMDELLLQDPKSPTALRMCLDRLMQAALTTIEPLASLAIRRADVAIRRGEGELGRLWLSVSLCLAPKEGLGLLKNWLRNTESESRDEVFVSAISAMIGHDGPEYPTERMACLSMPYVGELAQLCYSHVPLERDRVPGKVYSPNRRDSAERARSYLLEQIMETPGNDSVSVLEELAAAAPNPARRDRFLVLADQRRAENVELEALSIEEFVKLRRLGEFPPGNAAEFFQLIIDKADDIRSYLEGDDDQQKSLLRNNLGEHSVQIQLKTEFDRISRGLYTTYREVEVAERNAPDFVISSTNMPTEVAVEVKVADNGYSVKDLIDIIHDQLIGKYLRMPDRRDQGLLVLTYHGVKHYWVHPETKKHLKFSQIVEILRAEAAAATRGSDQVRGLAVVGIDLTDRTH